ncbi:MAG: hypothetical protein ABSF16_09100 [Terracidiphilus sp.]|jgi:hypothetical protein
MPSATAIRLEIERALEYCFPAVLTPAPRTIREVAPTGIAAVDALLVGGLPVGAISEITGPESSGRTSIALAYVAQRTAEGRVCAWVDGNDAFDPESAAANGVALRQLLWVRCRDAAGSAKLKAWPKPWTCLDQALRATDLLLQAGGFAAIVLDLGATAREYGNRIPDATWSRFRQAADRARCSLMVLGKAAYARSSAALALECSRANAGTTGGTVLRGLEFAVRLGRERFTPVEIGTRKPPASTWSAHAAWEAERRA